MQLTLVEYDDSKIFHPNNHCLSPPHSGEKRLGKVDPKGKTSHISSAPPQQIPSALVRFRK